MKLTSFIIVATSLITMFSGCSHRRCLRKLLRNETSDIKLIQIEELSQIQKDRIALRKRMNEEGDKDFLRISSNDYYSRRSMR